MWPVARDYWHVEQQRPEEQAANPPFLPPALARYPGLLVVILIAEAIAWLCLPTWTHTVIWGLLFTMAGPFVNVLLEKSQKARVFRVILYPLGIGAAHWCCLWAGSSTTTTLESRPRL